MISINTTAPSSELEELKRKMREEQCPKKIVQRLRAEVLDSVSPNRDPNTDYDGRISIISAEIERRMSRG